MLPLTTRLVRTTMIGTAMNRTARPTPLKPSETPKKSSAVRCCGQPLALLAVSIALLSLALAPFGLYFLAWVGLAPWIVVVALAGSRKAAFAWGFVGGLGFFLVNMWWLWPVSPPGLFALTIYLSIFWGFAALVVRALLRPGPRATILNPRHSILAVILIATAWTAFEWLRGNVSFLGKQGLPWLQLGQTQSPLLVMSQIADATSVLGVSFWVVMVNALVAMAVLNARQWRRLLPAVATVAGLLIAVGVYGAWRMSQPTTSPGPHVLLVQSNYKQSNTGEKGAPTEQIVQFHVNTTRQALREIRSAGGRVDLVVWSETMMPPINESARTFAAGTVAGDLWQHTYDAIVDLSREFGVAMLVGGTFQDGWSIRDDYLVAADRRNSAYFFDAGGRLSADRYDKVHLVPFGEYIPFESIPPIYRVFVMLGPNYYEDYVLTRGEELTVFSLETPDRSAPLRFVVPICFEDIVPSLVARMFDGNGVKRADLLVNITNDGWFRGTQMEQHLQSAVFRSIENRVPTARSVNTGVSALIDPLGRIGATIAPETEGWTVGQVTLDSRVAPYTRIGDAFPIACVAVTAAAVGAMSVNSRRRQNATEPDHER